MDCQGHYGYVEENDNETYYWSGTVGLMKDKFDSIIIEHDIELYKQSED